MVQAAVADDVRPRYVLLLWLLLQVLGAMRQASGLSAVSAMAHLGGAGVGLAAWLGLRMLARDACGYSPSPPAADR